MKKLRLTTRYKKDFKKYKTQPQKLQKLQEVLRMLVNEEQLPSELKPHLLKGELTGCMECHIESDFLLIWFDEDNNIIALLRLGTHSELFNE